MSRKCEMIVGYLVPHRCPNLGVVTCVKCQRHFCEEHVTMQVGGVICTACQQGLARPLAISKAAQTFDEADMRSFDQTWQDDYDDDDLFADLS